MAPLMETIISAVSPSKNGAEDSRPTEPTESAQSPVAHASLHTLVEELHAAVDKNPGDVDIEVVNLTQRVLRKMKATFNPNSEIEVLLKDAMADIEPKIEQGTVTKEEAAHLHSLESEVHGRAEKGGPSARALSVVAKRERGASYSAGKDSEADLRKVEFVLRPKIEHKPEHITKEDAALLQSHEERAHGVVKKGSLAATAMSLADKNANLEQAKEVVEQAKEVVVQDPEEVTKEDAALLQSHEVRAHGVVKKGSLAAIAMSLAAKNANLEQAKEVVVPKDPEEVTKDDAALLQSREAKAVGGDTEQGSTAAKVLSIADKNANLEHAREDVVHKDPEEITKDDAALLQSREAKAVGGDTEQGSKAAEVQSIADKKETQGSGDNDENKVAVATG